MARKKATRKRSGDNGDDAARSARPFWSGTLTFGLVSVPVDLYPGNRTNRAPLRMLSPEGEPLARRYYSDEIHRAGCHVGTRSARGLEKQQRAMRRAGRDGP